MSVTHVLPVWFLMYNCEHVADAVSALVHKLLATRDKPRILATSRERLGGQDEVVVSLSSLAHADTESPSVRLLVHRIGSEPSSAGADRRRDLAARCGGY